MINLELSQERQLLFHQLIQYVREVTQTLNGIKGYPYMLVFVALNCKAVPQEEGPIRVRSIPEIYLIIARELICFASLHYNTLVLFFVFGINEIGVALTFLFRLWDIWPMLCGLIKLNSAAFVANEASLYFL
jgi:hypothetical protein